MKKNEGGNATVPAVVPVPLGIEAILVVAPADGVLPGQVDPTTWLTAEQIEHFKNQARGLMNSICTAQLANLEAAETTIAEVKATVLARLETVGGNGCQPQLKGSAPLARPSGQSKPEQKVLRPQKVGDGLDVMEQALLGYLKEEGRRSTKVIQTWAHLSAVLNPDNASSKIVDVRVGNKLRSLLKKGFVVKHSGHPAFWEALAGSAAKAVAPSPSECRLDAATKLVRPVKGKIGELLGLIVEAGSEGISAKALRDRFGGQDINSKLQYLADKRGLIRNAGKGGRGNPAVWVATTAGLKECPASTETEPVSGSISAGLIKSSAGKPSGKCGQDDGKSDKRRHFGKAPPLLALPTRVLPLPDKSAEAKEPNSATPISDFADFILALLEAYNWQPSLEALVRLAKQDGSSYGWQIGLWADDRIQNQIVSPAIQLLARQGRLRIMTDRDHFQPPNCDVEILSPKALPAQRSSQVRPTWPTRLDEPADDRVIPVEIDDWRAVVLELLSSASGSLSVAEAAEMFQLAGSENYRPDSAWSVDKVSGFLSGAFSSLQAHEQIEVDDEIEDGRHYRIT